MPSRTADVAVAATYLWWAISISSPHPPPSILFASAQTYSDCDVASYYSSLRPFSLSPLDANRNDMHALVKNTHRDQLPYSSSSYGDVWDALIDVDGVDVVDAEGENDGRRVRLVYRDAWVPATPHDVGTCQYWNREHLWSRSHGVGSSGKDNTDLHHLRPSDCNVNSARNNLYFGSCGTAAPHSECDSPAHPEAAFDTEKDPRTFLPPRDVRGDVARAILYMDLRYDGDDAGSTTTDLIVSDCPEEVPDGAGMGYLSQLLEWHLEDPPDDGERARNGKVCADWQGNRNPFVDFPELASIYHGGSRPLLGDGLGYDCTLPPPSAGSCSDGSGPCSSADQCLCSSSATNRNLLGGVHGGDAPSSSKRELLETSASSKLIITGVLDGPLPGGLPKMVELYALDDVTDLSDYGVGSANNGGGSDGEEFSLPSSSDVVAAGSYVTVSSEASSAFLDYFGEEPTFVSGAVNVNGDDAIELFHRGELVDSYGENDVDGTGRSWEYTDGWAYRRVGSIPDSGAFRIGEWDVSGTRSVRGCATNDACGSSFPYKSFGAGGGAPPTTSKPTKSPTGCACLHE